DRFDVVQTPEQSLKAVHEPEFDPQKTVILENSPDPKPDPSSSDSPGSVRLIRMTCNELEISADLTRNAILLVTDAYSAGWRVRPIDAGSQSVYQVLPADHALRAIPLAAGKHHFILEYWPASLMVGICVSIIAWIGFCLTCGVMLVRSRHRR